MRLSVSLTFNVCIHDELNLWSSIDDELNLWSPLELCYPTIIKKNMFFLYNNRKKYYFLHLFMQIIAAIKELFFPYII